MSELWAIDADGSRRRGTEVQCGFCAKRFVRAKHRVREHNYCSRDCQGLARRARAVIICQQCGTVFETRKSRHDEARYCSRKCKEEHMSLSGGGPVPAHYGAGKGQSTYRQRAFKWHGPICAVCQYSKDQRMLDVHHIDGDRTHNGRENLAVLCVWCHAAQTRGVIDP